MCQFLFTTGFTTRGERRKLMVDRHTHNHMFRRAWGNQTLPFFADG